MIGTISLWAIFEDQFDSVKKIEKDLTAILILGEYEFDYSLIEGSREKLNLVVSYANSLNIPVYIATGIHSKENNLLDFTNPFYKNVSVIYWPTYWLSNTYSRMHLDYIYNPNMELGYDIDKIQSYDTFLYPYLSMNNMPHVHRCELMDMLAKHGILNEGKISWRRTTQYHFEYWQQKQLIIDQQGCEGTPLGLSREKMPECYKNTFLQVITESDFIKFTISMSTAVPLFLCKPFLTLGCPNYYHILEQYGFVKYDEIFDYSYDKCNNMKERTEKLALEIKRICEHKHMYKKWSDIIRDKLVYNRNQAIKIAVDYESFPNIWKQVAKQDYLPEFFNLELYPPFLNARIKKLNEKFRLSQV